MKTASKKDPSEWEWPEGFRYPPPIGTKIRIPFGTESVDVYHVRGYVDHRLVLRIWSPTKQRWRYSIEPPEYWITVTATEERRARIEFPKRDRHAPFPLDGIGQG